MPVFIGIGCDVLGYDSVMYPARIWVMRLLKCLIFLGFRGHVLDVLFYLMKNSIPI